MSQLLVNQPTAAPTRKVAAGGVAGAATLILIFIVQQVFDVVIPAEVASAATVLLGFVASYFTKSSV